MGKRDDSMDIREKMHSGALYPPGEPALQAEQIQCLERLYDFNRTRPLEREKRAAMLREINDRDREYYFKSRRTDWEGLNG